MKRNKSMIKQLRTGKSPYVTHQKKPYRYSASYYTWRASVMPRSHKKTDSENAAKRT